MAQQYQVPPTPRVISPSPTPSEQSESGKRDSYFAPITRSSTRKQPVSTPQPIPENADEDDEAASSDSSLEKRARTRSRSPVLVPTSKTNRRRLSGLTPREPKQQPPQTPITKSKPLTNGTPLPPQDPTGNSLSPYSYTSLSTRLRDFSRSPSPLGLIPLHRHYRTLIHKHEIPRKVLHVSIGFFTLYCYISGIQTGSITPYLLSALLPIAGTDYLRHHSQRINRFYIRCLGALMRETEVDGYNGVIWYLLGAYLGLRLFPKDVGVMSVLLLSWCDTAASTVGRLYGRYTLRLRKGKSLAGTLAAFFVGAATAAFFWGWLAPRVGSFPSDPPDAYMFTGRLGLPEPINKALGWGKNEGSISGAAALVVMSAVTGLVASLAELVDLWGWDDNLTIPVLSAGGIWGFLRGFAR
ncbi:MAG: hypothetical protein Q9160_003223 [Pyrenula sp. 1 TL-2023]